MSEHHIPLFIDDDGKVVGVGKAPARGAAQPVGWLHTLHMELEQTQRRLTFDEQHPFGKPGKDYSAEYVVTSEPVYTTPAREVSARDVSSKLAEFFCGKQALRDQAAEAIVAMFKGVR